MTDTRIILQARLNSSRLPGKMLLPAGGLPLVVLCARRAAASGYPVTVAISTEPSDDLLAAALSEHKIDYVRGDLDDVLARFLLAAKDMKDDDLVIRLTGDNPVVDGPFIQALVAAHKKSGGEYTRSLSPMDGLPYGLSAEIIAVKKLRGLDKAKPSAYEREHVTIHFTLNDDYTLFQSPLEQDLSHLRVTIDSFSDYISVAGLFAETKGDPVTVPWQTLVEKLQKRPGTATARAAYKIIDHKPVSRLALGTVQLGLPYGIANQTGKPSLAEAKAMLEIALRNGITALDTASAYGTAEEVIGACLDNAQKQLIEITTKLSPLPHIEEGTSEQTLRDAVDASIYGSCHRLGLSTLPCVLLHRWQHYAQNNGQIWHWLRAMQKSGVINKLGVSVQSPEEALEALKEPGISFIQLPYNILDGRWHKANFAKARAARPDVHIQARSALLQGVVLLPPEKWPVITPDTARETAAALQSLVAAQKRSSIQDLCYAYVNATDWIDSVVVGSETCQQLEENISLFNKTPLADVEAIAKEILELDIDLLDPSKWKKHAK